MQKYSKSFFLLFSVFRLKSDDADDEEVRRTLLRFSTHQGRLDNDVMNPGGGGGHMSYPGGGGGYPGGGGGYGYGAAQYAGYNHHATVSPGQMSPYGPGGLGVMGGQLPPQTSPYSAGEQFNNKTPPFQQSFQRPYSPSYAYGASSRHPHLQSHLHGVGGGDAVDLKTSSLYSGQNFPAAGVNPSHQNSSPYGYNGFGHSPHHQVTISITITITTK